MAANRRLPRLVGEKNKMMYPGAVVPQARPPLLVSINQLSPFQPSEWVCRSKTYNMYFVTFRDGVLTVRKNNKFTGEELLRITFPNRKHTSCMQTEEMLHHCGFRLNHYEDDEKAVG